MQLALDIAVVYTAKEPGKVSGDKLANQGLFGRDTMTKAELVEKIHTTHQGHLTKKLAWDIVDAVFDNVASAIRKDKRFSYPGFGTFVVRKRNPRMGRNPQTGEAIKIKASKGVGFRASKSLKDKL
jgi:DNA-binding protein HU-beta